MDKIVIDAPKHPVIRYKVVDERNILLDLRGIRHPRRLFNGQINPTKGSGRKFLTAEHLQAMVAEYFESCWGPCLDKWGMPVKDADGKLLKVQTKPYTVSGLALKLDVCTDTIRKYRRGKIDGFLDELHSDADDVLTCSKVIERARQVIQAYAEGRLYDKDGQKGAQYVLDCIYGWRGGKEQSDIDKSKADTKLKREEFDLKKRLLDEGTEDSDFTINIVRGRKTDDG